jgi:hypothetical protein
VASTTLSNNQQVSPKASNAIIKQAPFLPSTKSRKRLLSQSACYKQQTITDKHASAMMAVAPEDLTAKSQQQLEL